MAIKQSVKLKSVALANGSYEYNVLELINRLEPRIGTVLTERQALDLGVEANKIGSKLTVKIV